jgi:tetratricopeptide (TPR) repeat protein
MLGGEDAAAIDFAARIVGDSPQPDPEARLELAIMYLSVGRDDDALSQVNQVLLEQPSRTDALRMLAIINFRLGNLDAASDDFQDLLASGRYTMDALYYLARIADREEDVTRAIGLYTQVTSGQNVVPAQRRASALIAQEGEVETALSHLERFAERNPAYAIEMVAARAQLLVSVDRYDDALKVYDDVLRYRPESEGVLLGRAELLVRMDRVDEAIEQYEKALDMFPDSANTLNALGYTLADRTDRYREASRLIKKALKLDPESPAIIDSWGWVRYKQGDYEEALEYLRRAYRSFPDGEVAAHIVEVLWKMERTDEALEFLENAEKDSPDHPLLMDIRERAFPETVTE